MQPHCVVGPGLCRKKCPWLVPPARMDAFRFVCAVLLCAAVAHGKPTLRKERVLRDPELSRQAHEDNKSFQYDHEAFLGKEEAKTFDQLTPEESKDRLG